MPKPSIAVRQVVGGDGRKWKNIFLKKKKKKIFFFDLLVVF